MAQRHAQTRQQFVGAKRLGQVIVRAQVERGHFVALGVAHGKDEDGDGRPFAQSFAHVQAAQLGQVEIEDDGVWQFRGGPVECLFAVGGADHVVAVSDQARAQRTQNMRLVVNDQDFGLFHRSTICWTSGQLVRQREKAR